jgi:hypothetical protein
METYKELSLKGFEISIYNQIIEVHPFNITPLCMG